ncbi:hypothetical protein VTO42DRAFT_2066 [Malbranchea cinnamomea]
MGRNSKGSRRSGSSKEAMKPLLLAVTEIPGSEDSQESNTTLVNASNNHPEPGDIKLPSVIRGQRYDINTLLSIGRQLGAINPQHKRRVRFGREGSCVDPSSGSPVPSGRVMNRRRFSSTASNITENEYQGHRANVQYPIRQPKHAPEGNLAQTNEGFRRFLKEYSSPRHHRVTAGGRIVPMEPRHIPAPKFKLSTNPQANQANNRKVERPTSANELPGRPPQEGVTVRNGGAQKAGSPWFDRTAKQTSGSASSRRAQESSTSGSSEVPTAQDTKPSSPATTRLDGPSQPGKQPAAVSSRTNQPQLSAEACPFTPSYSNVAGGDAPPASVVPQYYPQVSIPQYMPEQVVAPVQTEFVSNLGNATGFYLTHPVVAPAPVQTYPFNNAAPSQWTNFMSPCLSTTGIQPNLVCRKTLEEATEEFDNISSQLSNLDRYMAIHAWDIDPLTKKALVDQRIDLVRKLDAARVLKEHLESISQSQKSQEVGVCPTIEQVQGPPYSTVFGSVQPPPFVPTPVLTAPVLAAAFPPVVNFQQITPPGQLFQGQTVGSQFGNADAPNTESGLESYAAEYGSNYQPSSMSMWGWFPNATACSSYGGFSNAVTTAEMPNTTSAVERGEVSLEGTSDPTPLEISNVYRKIEEAAQRGESVSPYLKELAFVIAQMGAPLPRREKTIQHLHRELQRQKQGDTANTTQMVEPPNNADDSNLATSHNQSIFDRFSTTDEREGSAPQEHAQSQTLTQLRLDALHRRNYSKESQRASSRNRMSQNENINPIGEVGQSATLPSHGGEDKPEGGRGKARETLEASTQSNEALTARRGSVFNAFSFPPWRNKGSTRSEQDAGTTEAQRVNVHVLPPNFDGSGEVNKYNQTDGTGKANDKDVSTTHSGGFTGWVSQWYRKASRKEHNAMDVRAFFQLLREEDKEMIRKHRSESSDDYRPFG